MILADPLTITSVPLECSRVCEGVMEMDIGYISQDGKHSVSPEEPRTRGTCSTGGAILHRESYTLEGVPVEVRLQSVDRIDICDQRWQ